MLLNRRRVHAAPTELGSNVDTGSYKHCAPNGAWRARLSSPIKPLLARQEYANSCRIPLMNIRYALMLAVSIASLLSGCTTTSEDRHIARVMRHRDWPRIEQIARTEVKRRELSWPDTAVYLPQEHKDKVWVVWAIAGTPNSDGQRRIALMIGDDGAIVMYKRYSLGER